MQDSITHFLLEKAGLVGILVLGIWFVARKLSEQYEARIKACENAIAKSDARHEQCEKDREALHRELLEIVKSIGKKDDAKVDKA
jgi:ABC-type nickel/cobalt efflux system permease component RcnA